MRHFYIKILFLKKSLLLFYEVAMSIAFLRKIMVRMLYFILLSLKNDTCNSFQTKIREPRVQTRLSVAEKERFELSNRFSRLHDFQSCALDQLGDFSKRY